jgi:hypothetical protein
MRSFGQVPIKVWRDRRFRFLSDDAKLAFLSLWCGPHSTSAGVMRLEDGYAALDLGCPLDKWQAVRREVEHAGLIKCNETTEEVLIYDFFAVNRPTNERARNAIANQIEAIECEHLASEAKAAFQKVLPVTKPAGRPVNNLETPYLSRTRSAA